jgi:hypothetical protein
MGQMQGGLSWGRLENGRGLRGLEKFRVMIRFVAVVYLPGSIQHTHQATSDVEIEVVAPIACLEREFGGGLSVVVE